MKRLLVGLAVVAAVGGCGSQPAKMPSNHVAARDAAPLPAGEEPPVGKPLTAVGERMSYRVALHGVPLAELVLETTGLVAIGARDALVVEMRVDTTTLASLVSAVHDRFTTWIDATTGRPLQFHAREAAAEDAGALEETEARFAPGQYPVRLLQGKGAGEEQVQVVQGIPFDFASYMIFLRGWEAAPGAEMTVDVMRSRFAWRARMVVGAPGNLTTALGDLPVVRFEGEAVRLTREGTIDPRSDRRRFTIWISDDADRVPVKLTAHTDYGDVILELTSYGTGP